MIVTLTDFEDSEYLGVMKGVIYSICKDAKIADLFNKVTPQNIKEASWILLNNYHYFPKKTIFLCVVDPGVGSKRNAIAVETKNYFFVGPDNGLMNQAILRDGIKNVVKLPTKGASNTFHGRDVFAAACAKLESGIGINKLGRKTKLSSGVGFYLSGRTGEITRIDNFGNIITNIEPLGKKEYSIDINNLSKKVKLYKTYEEAAPNKLFLIKGSSNTLEISIKNASAANKLKVKTGELIKIE